MTAKPHDAQRASPLQPQGPQGRSSNLQLSAPLFHHSIIPSPSPEFWILALAADYFF
jgi:hypothetical protein